jgi:hypothetical protein
LLVVDGGAKTLPERVVRADDDGALLLGPITSPERVRRGSFMITAKQLNENEGEEVLGLRKM